MPSPAKPPRGLPAFAVSCRYAVLDATRIEGHPPLPDRVMTVHVTYNEAGAMVRSNPIVAMDRVRIGRWDEPMPSYNMTQYNRATGRASVRCRVPGPDQSLDGSTEGGQLAIQGPLCLAPEAAPLPGTACVSIRPTVARGESARRPWRGSARSTVLNHDPWSGCMTTAAATSRRTDLVEADSSWSRQDWGVAPAHHEHFEAT